MCAEWERRAGFVPKWDHEGFFIAFAGKMLVQAIVANDDKILPELT
jgi:hypothetical protein